MQSIGMARPKPSDRIYHGVGFGNVISKEFSRHRATPESYAYTGVLPSG